MKKIGFIGAGNMGLALIKSLVAADSADYKIYVYDIDVSKKAVIEGMSSNVIFTQSAKEVVCSCEYVFLMVKPQQLGELLDETADSISSDSVLVSVCAGITVDFIRERLNNQKAKIVLAMPNTPLMLRCGATALAFDEMTSVEEFNAVRAIFETSGITATIPLSQMNHIICINGSSPAFIYLFAQGFLEYAQANEIEQQAAKKLFAQSLIGAANMLISSGLTVEQLIEQVSSKGGTTIAGLEKLRENGLETAVTRACTACTERAIELSAGQV
ncbi:MAG: pyrroline-5-carboxylate reductase [Oscillospiraceae bacterium]|nr:pyrroline-5-carboxylate reductase [Oscillospiraceae bacterium]